MTLLTLHRTTVQDALLEREGYHMLRRKRRRKAFIRSLIPFMILGVIGVIYFGAIWWIT